MLKIQNLSVDYGTRRILHDVSFEVQSGEILALIGPNGAMITAPAASCMMSRLRCKAEKSSR